MKACPAPYLLPLPSLLAARPPPLSRPPKQPQASVPSRAPELTDRLRTPPPQRIDIRVCPGAALPHPTAFIVPAAPQAAARPAHRRPRSPHLHARGLRRSSDGPHRPAASAAASVLSFFAPRSARPPHVQGGRRALLCSAAPAPASPRPSLPPFILLRLSTPI